MIVKTKKLPYTKDLLKDQWGVAGIGDYTYGCPKVMYWGENAELTIGKFCSIAEDVVIFLGGNHRMDWISTYPFPVSEDWCRDLDLQGHPASRGNIIIGNDVWIAHGATILSGLTIGDGAVIGARAVVTKDVDPYMIVAGNPAKNVRRRFDEDTVRQLLALKWWDWPYEKIRKYLPLLCSSNIEDLFKSLSKQKGIK